MADMAPRTMNFQLLVMADLRNGASGIEPQLHIGRLARGALSDVRQGKCQKHNCPNAEEDHLTEVKVGIAIGNGAMRSHPK